MRILLRRVKGRKKHPNWSGIVKEVERTLDAKVKPQLLEYPKKVVANWKHKPDFKAMKRVTKDAISVYVYPTGPNKDYWIWTSRGTRPHIIRPKKAKILAFPSVYKPKTTPRGPGYRGPGVSSGPTVFAKEVKHPGTKPRHFEEAWERYAQARFRKEMENAMRRGARNA